MDGEMVTFPHAFKDTNAVGQTRRCIGAEMLPKIVQRDVRF